MENSDLNTNLDEQANRVAEEIYLGGFGVKAVYHFPCEEELRILSAHRPFPKEEKVNVYYFGPNKELGETVPQARAMVRFEDLHRVETPKGWGPIQSARLIAKMAKLFDGKAVTESVCDILCENVDFEDWFTHLSVYDRSAFSIRLEWAIFSLISSCKKEFTQRWPAKGDRLVAKKNNIQHWFTNVKESCLKLEIGQTYTVRECNVASSWCEILLEEMEGSFSLSVFDWKVN